MQITTMVPGLWALQARVLGDSRIRIAVLDGPVDVNHPCFRGAHISAIDTLVSNQVGSGRMSRHGTHVASLIFGQPGSPVPGAAPRCQGLLLPIFHDYEEGRLPQLDLARAIERAVISGAHIVNISGGERSVDGRADPLLSRALQLCEDNNVLVVAAAGNEGSPDVHVPAAVSSVLAVGALGNNGVPLPSSNWGDTYRRNGIVAPGEGVTGGVPGGGTADLTGTSFATPIVTGVAALLMTVQLRLHGVIDPLLVRRILIESAAACDPDSSNCERYLAGVLDISRAYDSIMQGGTTVADSDAVQVSPMNPTPTGTVTPPAADVTASEPASAPTTGMAAAGYPSGALWQTGGLDPHAALIPRAVPSAPGIGATMPQAVYYPGIYPPTYPLPTVATLPGASVPFPGQWGPGTPPPLSASFQPAVAEGAVAPSGQPAHPVGLTEACGCGGSPPSYVYALGTVGFDFGTETRRDTFRQLMPDVIRSGEGEGGVDVHVSPNPYDVFQLSDYLDENPPESTKLIWTLNLDLTPIYAVEAEPHYSEYVYQLLRQALRNQALPVNEADFVARISLPGVLTGKTVQLFSGQWVPVIVVQRRGMYTWNETELLDSVVAALRKGDQTFDEEYLRRMVRTFLDKVYFECRNLGQTSADRALNFAVTNAYQFASGIVNGFLTGRLNVAGAQNEIYTLDTIDVSKSPYCRVGSDCWDVRVKWFNPENDRRAKSVYQFTVDVNDPLPVTLAPAHQYLTT